MATDLAKLAIRVESLEAKTAAKNLDGMTRSGKAAEKQTKGLSKAAKNLGKAFVGLFAAREIARIFANTITVAAKFEAAMSELSAITGLTGEKFQEIEKYAKDFGRTTTLSASQAAEAFKLVASTQPHLLQLPDQLANVTKAAITLAEATGSTLPDAADTVGQSLNQFGLDASEAGRVINVLAAGAQKGASFVNETAEALKYAGTVAATVKVSFESTNAAIQQLSTVGIKASEAGTALRNIFLKLEGQTESRFKPSVVGFEQALQNLKDSEISVTEQTELFGLRSVVAANNLINNAEAVDKLRIAITDTDIAYQQQKTKVDNLEGSIKQLKSAQEGLNIQIGGNGADALRGYVDILQVSINAYTDFLVATDRAAGGNEVLEEIFRVLLRTLFLVSNGFGVAKDTIEFFSATAVNSTLILVDAFSGVGRYFATFFDDFKIGISIAAIEIQDFGDSIGAFAARAVALLKFDFDLADQIKKEREATENANEAELEALRARQMANKDLRSEIISGTKEEISARLDLNDQYAKDFADIQIQRAEEIGMFFARTDASYKSQDQMQAEADLRAKLHEEGVSNEEELQELLNRRAQIADNQAALEDVAGRYATEIEAAEEAAAAELEILRALGDAKNMLTAEQEALRLETMQRVQDELDTIKDDAHQKELEDEERRAAELEEARTMRQDAVMEFKMLAAEDELDRAQLAHEALIEQLEERGEELGINKRLVDEALERLEEQHQMKLQGIREKAAKKQNKFDKWLANSKVTQSISMLQQMTAGVAQHSKTMFKVNKAAGIANAVINTFEGVSAALKLGPPQSFFLAPMQLAAGLAQVSAIKSTSFEGGGGGTTPSLAGSVPTVNGQPVQGASDDLLNPPDAQEDGTENRTNVVVTGNVGFTPAIIDEIADGLREATGERDVVIFDENSRQAQDIAGASDGGG